MNAPYQYHRGWGQWVEQQLTQLTSSVVLIEDVIIKLFQPKASILFRKEGSLLASSITIADSDAPCTADVVLRDAAGNPTASAPDSAPVWAESSNGTVVTVEASEDGLTATFTPKAPGASNVTVSLSVGGQAFVGTGTITVLVGQTTQVDINFTPGQAAPVPVPTPVPAPAPEPAPAP